MKKPQPDKTMKKSTLKTDAKGMLKKAGKPAGIFVSTVEEARARIEQGFTYIAYSTDTLIFAAACRSIVAGVRG